MKLSRAARKMANTTLECYDPNLGMWVKQSFGCQMSNSGRWIGRSEDFYNRRVLLTPYEIPPQYEVVRVGNRTNEYLIFSNEPSGQVNIRDNEAYLFEYNILNVEIEYAELVGLTNTPSASGINGKKVEESLGFFPVAVDRYAGMTNSTVKDTVQSKMNVYIPTYANANVNHILRLAGETYDIKEVYLELSLTHMNCVKL